MGSRKIRLYASGHLFIAFYLILASVVAFSRLLAQGTPQPQDLGPTDSSKMVTASLVLKVQYPDRLEAYVALPRIQTRHPITGSCLCPNLSFASRRSLLTFLSSRNI
jgi:hypothetical protein